MSPVDRADSVTGMNFAVGSYKKFQPGFRDEKRSKILGTSFGTKFGNKANMEKHKIFYFQASVNLKAVSLQSNGMLMMCKIQQAMKDDAIRTTRIHPAVHPGNREHVRHFLQYFQPAYRDLGWKNRNLGNRDCPPSHMNTYQGFRGKARSRKPPARSTGLI